MNNESIKKYVIQTGLDGCRLEKSQKGIFGGDKKRGGKGYTQNTHVTSLKNYLLRLL